MATYDYNAAISVLNGSRELFSSYSYDLLAGARDRLRLDRLSAMERFKAANKKGSKIKASRLFPFDESNKRLVDVFEYLLYMQTLLKTDNLLDFTRAVSPYLVNVFILVLKEKYKTDVEKAYCEGVTKGKPGSKKTVFVLKRAKLPDYLLAALDEKFISGYKDTEVSAVNISYILSYFAEKNGDASIVKMVKRLVEFEKEFRHSAAHEIVCMKEEDIANVLGCSGNAILDNMKQMFLQVAPVTAQFESYDYMNELIIDELLPD